MRAGRPRSQVGDPAPDQGSTEASSPGVDRTEGSEIAAPGVAPAEPPLGADGTSRVQNPERQEDPHFVPVPDRWRLGFPDWRRYADDRGAPYQRGSRWNPYRQNVLKADYPILGQHTFFDLAITSDTLAETRQLPVPSGVSAHEPGRFAFFGQGRQELLDQTFFLSGELFHGDTAFKPKDWAVRFTPAFNVSRLAARETGIVNVDVREGITRLNGHTGFQDLFAEYKIADLSPNYDFAALRGGIQPFSSDVRGFLFADSNRGARFFGNAKSNRYEYNLAYFRPLEKDTYSRLNTLGEDRDQDILIANLYRQDFLRPGFTSQWTFAYNGDHPSVHFDNNGIRVRPALIGDAKPHDVEVAYLGWNGSGHLDRINLTGSFYQAWGHDSHQPIAGRPVNINAQMAAAEVSYDIDWLRLKTSFFYASGDGDPRDGRARGFDAIFDAPVFAGGPFSFWNSQGIRLTGTGVQLVSENSLLPTLRSSKLEGQANFVNPGILIVNAGIDAELTPKWKASLNASWLEFVETRTLELVLNQGRINPAVGLDCGLGFTHRPFLNENVVLVFGASVLVPGRGFRDIYQGQTLYSVFGRAVLAY